MKIQRLLVETDGADFEQFMKQMATECHYALNNDIVLYRGMRFSGNPYDKHPIRTDRRSLSKKYAETAIFNQAFEAVHDIKDVRNKCAFVSTSKEDAAQYGAVHLVIPTNASELIFAPGVDDSIQVLNGWHSFTEQVKQLDPKITPEELNHVIRFSAALDNHPGITSEDFKGYVSSMLPERIQTCMEDIIYRQQQVAGKYHVVKPTFLDPSEISPDELGTEVMIIAPYYYALQYSWIVEQFGSVEEFMSRVKQLVSGV